MVTDKELRLVWMAMMHAAYVILGKHQYNKKLTMVIRDTEKKKQTIILSDDDYGEVAHELTKVKRIRDGYGEDIAYQDIERVTGLKISDN